MKRCTSEIRLKVHFPEKKFGSVYFLKDVRLIDPFITQINLSKFLLSKEYKPR